MAEGERKNIEALVALVQKVKGSEEKKETAISDSLCAAYSQIDNFSANTESKKIHSDLLWNLLSCRICNKDWLARKPSGTWQASLVQLARLLFRDALLQKDFFGWTNLLKPFISYGAASLRAYFSMASEEVERRTAIVRAFLSIAQKLCAEPPRARLMAESGLHQILMGLLSARDMVVIQSTLQVLCVLAESSEAARKALSSDSSNALDQTLQLLKDSDLLSQKLAAGLVRVLCAEEAAREQIRVYDGVAIIIGLLSTKNVRLQWHLAWGLAQLTEDEETAGELGQIGAIPIIIAELAGAGGGAADKSLDDWLTMATGLAAVLGQSCQVDANAQLIVESNGIHIMCRLLIAQLEHPEWRTNRNYQLLQCSLFRVLRLVFSQERNRHLFKRLFPAALFAAFIDVGHYVKDLGAYEPLRTQFSELLASGETEEVTAGVEAVNRSRAPIAIIGSYAVSEQLGAGAFGCVYKVTKKGADAAPLALKEIFMHQSMLEKESGHAGDKSFGDIVSEVKIIKHQLRHPNVVRYRRVFVENEKLYILMDFIEGACLKDVILTIKDKKQSFPEDRLWNILIQLVLALRYLHKEKKIIHRDLKPNNIMISDGDKVVLTDFGLAKHRGEAYLKSTAGTILYSCPEIVQNHPYGDKADIWALGCCIYEMCTLQPPFYSPNMLKLAQVIVEAKYKPLPPNEFTPLVSQVIKSCLTVNGDKRVDIIGLASLMSNKLLLHIDAVNDAAAGRPTCGATQQRWGMSLNESTNSLGSTLGSSATPSRQISASGPIRANYSPSQSPDGTARIAANIIQRSGYRKAPRANSHSADQKGLSMRSMIPRYQSGGGLSESRRSVGSLKRSGSAPSLPSIHKGVGTPPREKPRIAWIGGSQSDGFSLPTIRKSNSSQSLSSDGTLVESASSGGTVTIQVDRLQSITDPILELLGVLHRVVCISELGTGEKVDHKRRVVAQFKRQLFAPTTTPPNIKGHLKKLTAQKDESIPLDLGYADYRPVLEGIPSEAGGSGKLPCLSYAQLYACMERVLEEMRGGLGVSGWNYKRPPSRLLTPRMPTPGIM